MGGYPYIWDDKQISQRLQAFVQGDVPDNDELSRRFQFLWDSYGTNLVGNLVE